MSNPNHTRAAALEVVASAQAHPLARPADKGKIKVEVLVDGLRTLNILGVSQPGNMHGSAGGLNILMTEESSGKKKCTRMMSTAELAGIGHAVLIHPPKKIGKQARQTVEFLTISGTLRDMDKGTLQVVVWKSGRTAWLPVMI